MYRAEEGIGCLVVTGGYYPVMFKLFKEALNQMARFLEGFVIVSLNFREYPKLCVWGLAHVVKTGQVSHGYAPLLFGFDGFADGPEHGGCAVAVNPYLKAGSTITTTSARIQHWET